MSHLLGLSHLGFTVTDVDKAVDFYCNVLGFQKAFEIRVPEDIDKLMPGHPICALRGQVAFSYLKAPNGDLIEFYAPLPDADFASAGPNYEKMGFTHFSLLVDDIKAYTEELRGKGVTIDEDISLGQDNTYTAWIKDLDGNRIEIMEYTDQSLQVLNR